MVTTLRVRESLTFYIIFDYIGLKEFFIRMKEMKKKLDIVIKTPKPRNFALIDAQIKGLMRTKIIKNKKKENKKFDIKKEISYYISNLRDYLYNS